MTHANAGISVRPNLPPLARAVARLDCERVATLGMLLERTRGLARAHIERCRERLQMTSEPGLRDRLVAEIAAHDAIAKLAEALLDDAARTDRRVQRIAVTGVTRPEDAA